ncbi:MAG: DUF721 domain-containing protein [Armatimonadota bacterium]|nr:DUF721 domain-containing protein [Armatimonadota bacterium]MDR7451076.1 DUF721 domain-containing protein [Armatimonadota bacterium]MDR7465903.1 DUF721 domain-containing protein [Armatimonadota bacterium]MDR7493968.1 DUF721 domain-containing protein [Armatimonadota bacterium]MDR7498418.1 DUF721 domain-containing protein [Armatimonadota bacterium]
MLTSLRSILRRAARTLGVERAAYAALIEEMWSEVVGPEAAAHSRPAGLRAGVLVAEAEGPMWTQDLSARRAGIAAELNRRLEGEVVREIRFRQVAPRAVEEVPARPRPAAEAAEELSPDEIVAVERTAAEIADSEVREAVRKAMVSQLSWRKRHVPPSGR